MQVGGIVLCGGRSTRMGQPKLSLPFGDEVLLQRVVRILSEVVSPVVVVAAPNQLVPDLPSDLLIARDEQEGLGPLGGIGVGLKAMVGHAGAAYVSACDTPLLSPEFVRAVVDSLGDHELAIPREGKFYHPLAAVYRVSLAERVQHLIDEDRMRPLFLVEESDSQMIDVDDLRSVDPTLDSLRNLNSPADYQRAIADLFPDDSPGR